MDKTDVDVARQNRTNCKSKLIKFNTYLEKCKSDLTVVSVEEIKGRLKKIQKLWDEFDEAQLVLEVKAQGPTRETDRTDFENNYFKFTAVENEIINQLTSQMPGAGQNDTVRQNTIATQLEAENELICQRTIAAQLKVELNAQRHNELTHLRAFAASRISTAESSNIETPIIRSTFPFV